MALYEFHCEACNHRFEEITSPKGVGEVRCPKCAETGARKLISRFAVGGQGDLRESTMHGCHDCQVTPGEAPSVTDGDHHSHSHDDHEP